jgi:sigma-E factor negative regulatory protein RseC
MLEEQAEVMEVDGTTAMVACRAQQDCARCAEGKGCGGGLLGRWLGDRLHRVRVSHNGGLTSGECVVIGLDERVLLRMALLVYGTPLLAMFLGALGAFMLYGTDRAAGLGMIVGLVVGFAWVSAFSRKIKADERFQPRVMRRVSTAERR